MFAEAGEGIGEEAVGSLGEDGGIGGEEWEVEVSGEVSEESVASFLTATEMSAEGDGDIAGAEVVFEFGGGFEELSFGRFVERFGSENGMSAGEVDIGQSGSIGCAMQGGEEAGEVLVAGSGFV